MARRSAERPRSLAAVRKGVAWLVGEGVAAGWATSEWLADRVVGLVRRARRVVGERRTTRARRLGRPDRHATAPGTSEPGRPSGRPGSGARSRGDGRAGVSPPDEAG